MMNNQPKTTLKTNILLFVFAGLTICALAFGWLCLQATNRAFYDSTEKNLHSLTDVETIKIDNRLKSVEQYVNTLNIAISGMIDSAEQLTDPKELNKITEESRELIRLTIGNTEKVVAAYLRFSPRLTPPTSGVFMAKTSADHDLQFTEPTDFSKYSPDDIEHVGWYYIPIKTNRPIWMSPYQNKNIGIYMISYIIPIFKSDKAIGVVGVDIDFDYLTREIASIHFFDNDYAYLSDKSDNALFHPSIPKGQKVTQPENSVLIQNKLTNGMNLTFVIPQSSISANRDTLIKNLTLITLIILVTIVFATLVFSKSFTKILKSFITDTEPAKENKDIE